MQCPPERRTDDAKAQTARRKRQNAFDGCGAHRAALRIIQPIIPPQAWPFALRRLQSNAEHIGGTADPAPAAWRTFKTRLDKCCATKWLHRYISPTCIGIGLTAEWKEQRRNERRGDAALTGASAKARARPRRYNNYNSMKKTPPLNQRLQALARRVLRAAAAKISKACATRRKRRVQRAERNRNSAGPHGAAA